EYCPTGGGLAPDVWSAVTNKICDYTWKIDFGKLHEFAGGENIGRAVLYGSRPPGCDVHAFNPFVAAKSGVPYLYAPFANGGGVRIIIEGSAGDRGEEAMGYDQTLPRNHNKIEWGTRLKLLASAIK